MRSLGLPLRILEGRGACPALPVPRYLSGERLRSDKMLLLVCVLLVRIVGVAHALDFRGPRATANAVLDPRGWSPKPTSAPYYQIHRRSLQKRTLSGLTDTCAWLTGAPLTCPTGQYCAYGSSYMACCTTNASGDFDSDCAQTSACLNQAESSSLCPATDSAACSGTATGFWYVNLVSQDSIYG